MSSSSSSPAEVPAPVIVWCHPRSCSTAFERALMQQKDTFVFHEPLSYPFYYSQDRACHRYSDEVCRQKEHWDTSVQTVTESLLLADPASLDKAAATRAKHKTWPPKYVFIKDMAQYIFPAARLRELHPSSTVYPAGNGQTDATGSDGQQAASAEGVDRALENPTVLPTWLLRRFKHTFLIRTPEKSVPSYWKCVEEKAAGYEFFDGAEAGYAELRILYDWMANPQSTFHTATADDEGKAHPGAVQDQLLPPPLIDASTLLAHPEHTVSAYCEAVGIPFDPQMLSWESGPVEEFKKWGTYHKGAENSTGFKQTVPKPDGDGAGGKKKELPAEVKETIEKCIDDYKYLAQKATIKPPSA